MRRPDLSGQLETGVAGVDDCPAVAEIVALVECLCDLRFGKDEHVAEAFAILRQRLILVVADDVYFPRISVFAQLLIGQHPVGAAVRQNERDEPVMPHCHTPVCIRFVFRPTNGCSPFRWLCRSR